MSSGPETRTPSRGRLLQFTAMVIIGASFGGFYIGTREAAYQAPARDFVPPPIPAESPGPAVPYKELALVKRGPNADWPPPMTEMLGLPPAEPNTDHEAKLASLERRAERRAYNGAPPIIPHPVHTMQAMDCMVCHESGVHLGDQFAPIMSHDFYMNCTQCHAPVAEPLFMEAAFEVPNVFRGLPAPEAGERAWEGAPPVIPHTTHMRQNCLACHGTSGWPGLHTTHPERQDCRQCHASQAPLEQHVSALRLHLDGPAHGE